MTGQDKAKEVRDKIAGEVSKIEEMKQSQMTESLSVLAENKDLAQMYNEAANVGSENIGGESLPILKVHSAGKSIGDELANGEEPKNGYFYFKKTKEEFKSIKCHILTISEGFRADGIEGKTNVFNQILAGVIINDGEFEPFLMYFTGTKLQRLWDFGKKASEFTKAKPQSIPMFALTVTMTTEKVIEGAKSWFVVNFEIDRNLDGTPVLVSNSDEFILLRDSVATVKKMIGRMIATKSNEDIIPAANYESGVITAPDGSEIPDILFPSEPMPF